MRVGLGCVGLGSGAGRRVADDVTLVQRAVDLGITAFDTADAYGNGASERVLGRALRDRRDDVVIGTKGGFLFQERPPVVQWARRHGKAVVERLRSGPLGGVSARAAAVAGAGAYANQDFSPRYLRDAVHGSLRRLGTDRIDVYQLHGPPHLLPDLVDQLSDLVAVGDVVRFGVGADSVAVADEWIGEAGIEVVQVPFGVLDPEAAETTFALARRHGTDLWVRGVLAGGVLGLAERDPAAVTGDRNADRIDALRRIASDTGLDRFRLALGFVQAFSDDVAAVFVGSTSADHLRRNVELLQGPPLDPDILDSLVALGSPARESE